MTDSRDEHEPYAITPVVKDADIVPWLRREADATAHQPSPWMMLAAAADTIERLRADLNVMTEEHRLACDDRDLMVRERDGARRAYCAAAYRLDSKGESTPMSIAHQQGWDCFKNATSVKTLKGVVVSKGKALPPKFELGEDDK